jgi:glycosyltransferase involved in cell wall biosynthesis
VASVIDAGGIGGAENLLTAMLACRDRTRYEDGVLILGPPHPLAERVEGLGVPCSAVDLTSGFRWAAARAALDVLAKFEPDVLHSHLRTSDVLAWSYAMRRQQSVAWVSTLHCRGELYAECRTLGSRIVWEAFRRGVLGAPRGRLCAVTEGTALSFLPYASPRARLEVVRNGISLARFRHPSPGERADARAEFGIPDGAVAIVAVGRLHPVKGHSVLVDAFAGVSGSEADAVLLIAGEGPEREGLEERIAAHGLGHRVRLLGAVSEVERLLWAADLFALPSLSEALPLALIEALACGVPVVCSGLESLPSNLIGPSGCVVVAPGDAHALGEALAGVIENHDRRAALRERVRAMSLERWSIERTTRRYEDIYDEELASRRRTRSS